LEEELAEQKKAYAQETSYLLSIISSLQHENRALSQENNKFVEKDQQRRHHEADIQRVVEILSQQNSDLQQKYQLIVQENDWLIAKDRNRRR